MIKLISKLVIKLFAGDVQPNAINQSQFMIQQRNEENIQDKLWYPSNVKIAKFDSYLIVKFNGKKYKIIELK